LAFADVDDAKSISALLSAAAIADDSREASAAGAVLPPGGLRVTGLGLKQLQINGL